jgi:hypothetical protein
MKDSSSRNSHILYSRPTGKKEVNVVAATVAGIESGG